MERSVGWSSSLTPCRKERVYAYALVHHSTPAQYGRGCAEPRAVAGPANHAAGRRHRTPGRGYWWLTRSRTRSISGEPSGLTLREQPAAVEIIPGEVIRTRGDLTAQEAVTRATGITAAGTPGDGSSALASRGFVGNDSVTQLYDGTRLYVGAATMTFPVDTWLMDRVEVLRGPASVIDGVGAIGGAINYVPRQPLRQQRLTDALFSAGATIPIS